MGDDGSQDRRFQGMRNIRKLADIPDRKQREAVERGLELGLEAAPSVNDRTISTFARGQQPAFAGINTFRKASYVEDVHEIGKHEVAIVGAPFDMGTTYRAGCRFGPQAIRRISALYDSYSVDMAIDLEEELDLVDLGDVFVIPSNIEKSFDQIDRAISWIVGEGVFPVVLGGDHSIGYPDVRGIAPHIDGRVGIIHLDRHLDLQERDMDERMHTTPWFHATNIANAPPANLVQMGIGGWYGSRPGVKVARERQTTVLTITDIEEVGVEKAAEAALDVAWKDADAVFLSFDIDSVDAGFVPGTGSPEPGGLLPREALKLLRLIAREGICGMEVVEVAPPYDVSDMTAQLACRAVMDVLGTLVAEGKLGSRAATAASAETGPPPEPPAS
jgi:agmatinase